MLLFVGNFGNISYIHKNIPKKCHRLFSSFKAVVPSVPVFIFAAGQYEVDYKIIIACRDSNIYIMRRLFVIDAMLRFPPSTVFHSSKEVKKFSLVQFAFR